MTNTPYKFTITQDTADTTKSKQFNLTFPAGKNAYRIDSLRLQIDDFDTIVTGDSWTVQISYKDLNGLALETIDADDEIFTIGQDFLHDAAGTSTSEVWFKDIRNIANGSLVIPVNKFVVKDEFYVNFDCVGQDAAEALHAEMNGQYVNLGQSAMDKLQKMTKL